MKHFAVLLASILCTAASCNGPGPEPEKVTLKPPVIRLADAEPLLHAKQSYPAYCVYYPKRTTDQNGVRHARVPIIGVTAEEAGGWTTAEPVVLSSVLGFAAARARSRANTAGTNSGPSHCTDDQHFNETDTLRIVDNRGIRTLILTRGGAAEEYPLSVGYQDTTQAGSPVLWYKTGVHEGYEYYVYLVNLPVGSHFKQRYWIEAFRVGGVNRAQQPVAADGSECLREQPLFLPPLANGEIDANDTVDPISSLQACPETELKENGIGAGDEPKPPR